MKRIRSFLALVLAVALVAIAVVPAPTFAASPAMPGVGSAVQGTAVHISGQYTATKTGLVTIKMPYNVTVLYLTAAAQAKGGTHSSSRIRCDNAGNQMADTMDLGTPAAATVVEATLLTSRPQVAKDASLTCDLVVSGGSAPTLDGITLMIWWQRR